MEAVPRAWKRASCEALKKYDARTVSVRSGGGGSDARGFPSPGSSRSIIARDGEAVVGPTSVRGSAVWAAGAEYGDGIVARGQAAIR